MSESTSLITGTVVDADGGAISGATVAIVSGTQPFPEIAAVTAADGTFQLGGLHPGTYVLRARRGTADGMFQVEAVAGEPTAVVIAIG